MTREASQKILIDDRTLMTNLDAEVRSGGYYTLKAKNGTGASQIDRVWEAKDLNVGAGLAINLTTFAGIDVGGGAGKDDLGQQASFAEILYLKIVSTGPGIVQWASDLASQPWTGANAIMNSGQTYNIFPSSAFVYISPGDGTLVVSSGDEIYLIGLSGDASGDYPVDILITGRSA